MPAKNLLPIVIRTAKGLAQHTGKSEGWARLAFKSGTVPTEFLIEGRQPAITEATLKTLALSLSDDRRCR